MSRVRAALKKRRLVSAAILVFVFFLPLHFHFSFGSQLNKECSCLQGVRTQLAPSADVATIVPQVWIIQFATSHTSVRVSDEAKQQYVRGPPSSTSL